MNNLGWTYYYLGKLAEAKEVATQVESVRKTISGVDHPKYKIAADLLRCTNEALARQESSIRFSSLIPASLSK
jgi:tetratricopeptide repeat protein